MRIKIKPISVNDCWQGRRFKTRAYSDWEQELLYVLPKIDIPQGELALRIEFGLSNKNADIDNGLKPLLDVLQKKYGFNDRLIYKLEALKIIVPKGGEYIEVTLSKFDPWDDVFHENRKKNKKINKNS